MGMSFGGGGKWLNGSEWEQKVNVQGGGEMKVEIKNTNHFIRSHQYSVNAFMVAYWLALLHWFNNAELAVKHMHSKAYKLHYERKQRSCFPRRRRCLRIVE